MEFVIGIVVIVVIIFIIGGMANDRPVSEWDDGKLVRMRDKLQTAASANMRAGNHEAYKKHADKKQEVDDEIVKREKAIQDKEATKLKSEAGASGNDIVVTDKALKAADAGEVKAQTLVGMSYLSGQNGLPEDPAKASKYLLMAAMQDDPHAAFMVSALYIEGIGFEKDRDKARLWANKAKSLGYPNADDMLKAIDAES